MLALGLLDVFLHIRVTREAEGTLFVNCHSFDIACMGIVACLAHSFRKRVMVRAANLSPHEVSVTLGAHFRVR
jgi:hypothetical protein